MKTYFIYTLSNPKNGEIFYVGRTINPKARSIDHNTAYGKYRSKWYSNFIAPKWSNSAKDNYIIYHKIHPILEILDEVTGSKDDANALEIYWIHQLRAWGFSLTNIKNSGRRLADVKMVDYIKPDSIQFYMYGVRQINDQSKVINRFKAS